MWYHNRLAVLNFAFGTLCKVNALKNTEELIIKAFVKNKYK